MQPKELPTAQDIEFVPVRRADLLNTLNSTAVLRGDLEQFIESAPFLYVLKKNALPIFLRLLYISRVKLKSLSLYRPS